MPSMCARRPTGCTCGAEGPVWLYNGIKHKDLLLTACQMLPNDYTYMCTPAGLVTIVANYSLYSSASEIQHHDGAVVHIILCSI